MGKFVLNQLDNYNVKKDLVKLEDNESRIKFWKEYYNPKVEVTSREVPTIDISLIKNNPFYQIRTTVENFNFTPEKNMKNNLLKIFSSKNYKIFTVNNDGYRSNH